MSPAGPFKCCGCGASAIGRKKPCFCITICGYRPGEDDKTEYTTFIDVSEPDENGWMLVESAPKDGETIVWLWYPQAGRATEGITYAYHDGSVGTSSSFKGMEPTHWQPLPKPPVASTAPYEGR